MEFHKFLPPGLIGILALGGVAALNRLSGQSRPDHQGWRHIKPGPTHWTGVVLGAALTVFFRTYGYLSVPVALMLRAR